MLKLQPQFSIFVVDNLTEICLLDLKRSMRTVGVPLIFYGPVFAVVGAGRCVMSCHYLLCGLAGFTNYVFVDVPNAFTFVWFRFL